MIGKISVTDLNIAQKEKDDAKNNYFHNSKLIGETISR